MVLRFNAPHRGYTAGQHGSCRVPSTTTLVPGLLALHHMKRLLLVALFFPSVIALGGLDLSPFPSEFEGEGVKYTRLTLKEDKRQVNYGMPLNWTYRGSSSQLWLTPPPAFRRADAIVEVSPLLPAQPLDEKVAVALRQQFLSSPPPGAQEVKLVSEEASPVLLNGNIQTWEFTMSYKVFGET